MLSKQATVYNKNIIADFETNADLIQPVAHVLDHCPANPTLVCKDLLQYDPCPS